MRRVFAGFCALLLVLTLLVGCTAAPSSASGAVLPLPSSQSEEPATGSAFSERPYTASTVEQIPELAEVSFSLALGTGLYSAAALFEQVQTKGLENAYVHHSGGAAMEPFVYRLYYSPEALYTYVQMYYEHHQPSGNLSLSGKNAHTAMQQMAAECLTEEWSEKADLLFASYYDTQRQRYRSLDEMNTNPSTQTFYVRWQDDGQTRTVSIKNALYEKDVVYSLVYIKGEDSAYRLQDITVENAKKATPEGVEGATLIEQPPEIAQGIVGQLGNYVVSLVYWDQTLTLTAMDAQTFEAKITQTYEGRFIDYRLRNNELFLLFEDQVLVVGSNLRTSRQSKLPGDLLSAIERANTYYCDPYDYSIVPSIVFKGYDVTNDLATFAYSTEEGLFLLDAATGNSLLLHKSEIIHDGPYDALVTPTVPFFTADNSSLYAKIDFDGQRSFVRHNLLSVQTEVLTSTNIFQFLSADAADSGAYFYTAESYEVAGTLIAGANHYYLEQKNMSTGEWTNFYYGRLEDWATPTAVANPAPGIVCAILADGRILVRDSCYFYYYAQPY